MADFFQNGSIATLHRLGEPDLARLESELTAFAAERPIALALPCHAREIGTPALDSLPDSADGSPDLAERLKRIRKTLEQKAAEQSARGSTISCPRSTRPRLSL